MHNENKKVLEYDQAPSGFVTLYNVKEPYMPYKSGFGFRGVLMFDGKTDKIQCHICGEWFDNLTHHLKREHAMNAAQYKEEVELGPRTALISETYRSMLIESCIGNRATLQPGKKKSEETKQKIREGLKKYFDSFSHKNAKGTCPMQLIERLKKLAEKLGRTPLNDQCTFKETVIKTFGTYNKGLEAAGLTPHAVNLPPVQWGNKNTQKYTPEILTHLLQAIRKSEGRYPSWSDMRRRLIPPYSTFRRNFEDMSWHEILHQVFPEYKIPK